MQLDIAIASVVTAGVLDEFLLCYASFELFHALRHEWFVRCDRSSVPQLSRYPNINCTLFSESSTQRWETDSEGFQRVVAQKMNAMDDAWSSSGAECVIFLDSDILFTAPLTDHICKMPGEVLLTPSNHPARTKYVEDISGRYNAGFVVSRTPRFHRWWREAFLVRPRLWADQICLNEVGSHFTLGVLSTRANIGYWHSSQVPLYDDIPEDCIFLHAHFFQPLKTTYQLINKSFALHCLKFLRASSSPEHAHIIELILAYDRAHWYKASLRLL